MSWWKWSPRSACRVPTLARWLGEAVDAGVVQAHGTKQYSFHHPLLAEVLYSTLAPHEARDWHAAFVAPLSSRAPESRDRVQLLGELARHHQRAGQADAAYECSVAAAEEASGIRAYPEAARYLRRASRFCLISVLEPATGWMCRNS